MYRATHILKVKHAAQKTPLFFCMLGIRLAIHKTDTKKMIKTKNTWGTLLFSCLTVLSIFFYFSAYAAPQSFGEAKVQARQHVYANRNQSEPGTLYCGCKWRWTGKTGGRVDLDSCGYEPRKNANRAARIEWEHIVPAWVIGYQRQCWQKGGRKNCTQTDPVFRVMEADLFNLTPVIGEVNGDRSNYLYGMVYRTMPNQYGQCTTRTDFKERTTEPRDSAKGFLISYFSQKSCKIYKLRRNVAKSEEDGNGDE
ncbi:Extracellular deoxyribonuclease (modular protein) [Nitrosomonas mobilis]|uniref:Extracellular deoxyribonuclease (Modular protein) n=2 Tax=Nitrosomonas mobilis TaxID=51642 RepID=A0A1G5SIF9_9PROT|nr:Extracellular deoxyribonuclease (modular protein) [Nitrosomonas mobilis]